MAPHWHGTLACCGFLKTGVAVVGALQLRLFKTL